MIALAAAVAWGVCILLAMIGWGIAVNRLLAPRMRFDWAMHAVFGIAFNVSVGGLLNLAGLVSRPVVLAFVALGFAFSIAGLWRRRDEFIGGATGCMATARDKPLLLVAMCALLSLLAVQFVASAHGLPPAAALTPYTFNAHDDYYAYFVFPRQMIDLGAMSADPFSYRRLSSALGGQSYLHAFVLAVLSEENLHLIDPGLGVVIVAGLLWAHLARAGATPWTRIAFVGAFLLIPAPTVNVTALVLGLALFVSLFRLLGWPDLELQPLAARATLLALLVATLFALKSTLIPAAALTLAVSYFLASERLRQWRAVLPEIAAVAAITVLLLAAWMLLLYQSSGTLLYPLLGSGYRGAGHGTIFLLADLPVPKAILVMFLVATSAPVVALVAAGLPAIARYRAERFEARTPGHGNGPPWRRHAALSLWGGAIGGSLVLHLLSGDFDASRYTYPFVYAAIFMLDAETVARWAALLRGARESRGLPVLALLTAGILLGSGWNGARQMYMQAATTIRQAIAQRPLAASGERARYEALQQAVPPGESILTRLEKPFLLDFRRNSIFVVDQPGGASPPPGMPSLPGSEPLASYLIGQRIRYVAFSYANDAGYSRNSIMQRIQPDGNVLTRNEAQDVLRFHDRLVELGQARRRIYDDGENFVLDLLAPGLPALK